MTFDEAHAHLVAVLGPATLEAVVAGDPVAVWEYLGGAVFLDDVGSARLAVSARRGKVCVGGEPVLPFADAPSLNDALLKALAWMLGRGAATPAPT